MPFSGQPITPPQKTTFSGGKGSTTLGGKYSRGKSRRAGPRGKRSSKR